MISYFRLGSSPLFLNYVHSGQSYQMIFSLFVLFFSHQKIFFYSIKNICEPFSEKSLFDYLCGSFHSSLIFLCK